MKNDLLGFQKCAVPPSSRQAVTRLGVMHNDTHHEQSYAQVRLAAMMQVQEEQSQQLQRDKIATLIWHPHSLMQHGAACIVASIQSGTSDYGT